MGALTAEKKSVAQALLIQFIYDLCAETLNKAGYKYEVYAFILHIAVRRQLILNNDDWLNTCWYRKGEGELSQCSEEKRLLAFLNTINDEKKEWIKNVAEAIVDEVQSSANDAWAVRLLKTGFLNCLEKTKTINSQAILVLASPQSADLSASCVLSDDQDALTNTLIDLLQHHNKLIDALFSLPVVLEKLIKDYCKGAGYNYEPHRNVEALLQVISTLERTSEKSSKLKEALTAVFNKIILYAAPNIPVDRNTLNTFIDNLLPYINQLIAHHQSVERKKPAFFTDDTKKSRTQLLALLGVEVPTLYELVQTGLYEPIEQSHAFFNKLSDVSVNAAYAFNIECPALSAADSAPQNNLQNPVDRSLFYIQTIQKLNDLPWDLRGLDCSQLPAWMTATINCYTALKEKADYVEQTVSALTNTAYNGLGFFYNTAVSFIPESLTEYFSSPSTIRSLVLTIKNSKAQNAERALAHLAFRRVVESAGLPENTETKFYAAFMSDALAETPQDYQQYQADSKCLQPSQSLNSSIAELNSPHFKEKKPQQKKFHVLHMIVRLQELEQTFQECMSAEDSIQTRAILSELDSSLTLLKKHETAETSKYFKDHFFDHAARRILRIYGQQTFTPLLETLLDGDDYLIDRPLVEKIYTKLRSDVDLSPENIVFLAAKPPEKTIFTEITDLTEHLSPPVQNHVTSITKTPKALQIERTEQRLQATLLLLPSLERGLQAEHEKCRLLQRFAKKPSNLDELCEKKMRYISALAEFVADLQQNIATNSLLYAKNLISFSNGQAAVNLGQQLSKISVASMATNVMRFMWYVCPDDGSDTSLLHNLLEYGLSENFTKITRARKEFLEALNRNPFPALTPLLDDPLNVNRVVSSANDCIGRIITDVFGINETSAVAWITRLCSDYSKSLFEKINCALVFQILPYPFLGNMVVELLKSESFHDELKRRLPGIFNGYRTRVNRQAKECTEVITNYLYPLLGVMIERKIQEQAYEYTKYNPEDRAGDSALEKLELSNQSDAFSLFYLQYAAVKQNNPDLDSRAFVAHLFADFIAKNLEDKAAITEGICARFQTIERTIVGAVANEQESLLLLVQGLDFTDVSSLPLIRLALINRMVLARFRASSALSDPHQAQILQIEAINALQKIFQKLPGLVTLEPGVVQEPAGESLRSLQSRTSALKPAFAQAKAVFSASLNKAIENAESALDAQRRDLTERDIPELFGKTTLEVAYEKNKKVPIKIVVAVIKTGYELISLVLAWMSLPLVFSTFTSFLPSLIAYSGVASFGGIGVFALIALVRFAVEIYAHKGAFKNIAGQESSSLKKFLLYTLLLAQCFLMAVVKTFISDYVFDKLAYYFAKSPIERAISLFRTHPEQQRIAAERTKLEAISTHLATLTTLMTQGKEEYFLVTPQFLDALDAVEKDLEASVTAFKATLITTASNDVRRGDKAYIESINAILRNVKAITPLVGSLKVAYEMEVFNNAQAQQSPVNEKALQDEMAEFLLVENPQSAREDANKLPVEVDGFIKQQKSTLENLQAKSASGFFERCLQVFGYFWPHRQDREAESALTVSALFDDFMVLEPEKDDDKKAKSSRNSQFFQPATNLRADSSDRPLSQSP